MTINLTLTLEGFYKSLNYISNNFFVFVITD